jgi:hypothetical protein
MAAARLATSMCDQKPERVIALNTVAMQSVAFTRVTLAS